MRAQVCNYFMEVNEVELQFYNHFWFFKSSFTVNVDLKLATFTIRFLTKIDLQNVLYYSNILKVNVNDF